MADSEDEYTTESDSSYLEEDFVYCRSRGRSRKEDSRKRRYRKKMRARGHRSPESEERRSLTPYNWNSKKMIKSSKSHKKKQIKAKKAFGMKKDSKDTLNKHDTSHVERRSSTEKLERKGDKQIPQNENRTRSNDSNTQALPSSERQSYAAVVAAK